MFLQLYDFMSGSGAAMGGGHIEEWSDSQWAGVMC